MAKRRSRVAGSGSPAKASTRHATRSSRSNARSVSAKKGWRTRRAKAEARSKAAKKGWQTRRATLRRQTKRVPTKPSRSQPRKPRKLPRTRASVPAGPAEFAVSADYRSKRSGSSVGVQISAIGPRASDKADAQAALDEKIRTGRSPRGWKIKMIDWKGQDAWAKLRKPLSLATIKIR